MAEYYVSDNSVPADYSRVWSAAKEAEARKQVQSLKDYFTELARREGVESRLRHVAPMLGFAPPMLQVFMDDATAQQLEKASNGRLSVSKLNYHSL